MYVFIFVDMIVTWSLFLRFPCPEHYCYPVASLSLAGNATRVSVWADFASGCMCHRCVLPAVYVPVYPLFLGISACFITWRKHRLDNKSWYYGSCTVIVRYSCILKSLWSICPCSYIVICRKSSVWLLHGPRAQPADWRIWFEIFLWTKTWINRLGKSLNRCLYEHVCAICAIV